MRETEPSKRPLTPAEKRLDRQMNDYLDWKIKSNIASGTPEGKREAIVTTATRIFSRDAHKGAETVNRYHAEVQQEREDLKRLDKQFTRYLDRKIMRNVVANTPESRKEAIVTTAVRIFSRDAHKGAATLNGYVEEAARQGKVQISEPKGKSKPESK